MKISEKNRKRIGRKARIKGRVKGTPERPRLVVFRSLNHIYAQIVDDTLKKTVVSYSSKDKDFDVKAKSKKEKSAKVGEIIAKKALEKNIKKVVFDRNGYKYHGRVKIVADEARKAGLEF